MLLTELGTSWTRIAEVVVAGTAIYVLVIVLTRLAGVRALAKMSTFDFGLQYVVALLRRRDLLHGLVDNRPVVLMTGGTVLEENLRHVRLSRAELWAQLRQAGVVSLDEVRAVVMETSGDVSVLRAGRPLAAELLDGVRGADALR